MTLSQLAQLPAAAFGVYTEAITPAPAEQALPWLEKPLRIPALYAASRVLIPSARLSRYLDERLDLQSLTVSFDSRPRTEGTTIPFLY